MSTELIEMFSSLQGEGALAGYRQIFLRFPGCNLDCAFCDTVVETTDVFKVETAPGSCTFRDLPQPVSLSQVIEIANEWCATLPNAHHSFSITGGEPLLHSDLLQRWLPILSEILPIHLETNGALPEALSPLLEHIDFISMDIKLPSSAATPALWEEHEKFLKLAEKTELVVKVIVGELTSEDEVIRACRLVEAVDSEIPFIIQPVTGRDGRVSVAASRLLKYQSMASAILADVRVIPQMHRFMEAL